MADVLDSIRAANRSNDVLIEPDDPILASIKTGLYKGLVARDDDPIGNLVTGLRTSHTTAREGGAKWAQENPDASVLDAVRSTTNAKMIEEGAKDISNLVTLPRDVYEGTVDPVSDESIERSVRGAAQMGKQGVQSAALSTREISPSQLNVFAGPTSKTYPRQMEARARGLESLNAKPSTVHQETGMTKFPGTERHAYEIDDMPMKINKVEGKDNYWMSNFVEHPELYEAYPWARKVGVHLEDMPSSTYGSAGIPHESYAATHPEGFIRLNKNLNDAELRETLLHEMQHHIQNREGWPGGSNPQAVVPLILKAMNEAQRGNPTQAMKNVQLIDAFQKLPPSQQYRLEHRLYTRDAGEIQANIAGQRAFLDAAERKSWPPVEDLPPGIKSIDEAIVPRYSLNELGR